MALIKCPECGREKVSSMATACPDCGYPIKQHFENGSQSHIELSPSIYQNGEIVYYEMDCKNKVTFDSGLSDGAKGKHRSGINIHDYWVVGNQVHIAMPTGEARYTITKDFLLNENGKFTGFVPDGNLFSASCKRNNGMGALLGCDDEDKKEFFADGRYSEIFWGDHSKGYYKRKNDLIVVSAGSTGNKPSGEIIYENSLYFAAYISPEKATEMRKLIQEAAPQPTQTKSDVGVVKCPYCKSTAVSKIGSVGRFASVGFWGIASSKVGKQWHCHNCNSDF